MKRILTAVVALPILLFTVWSPSPYYFVILSTIAVLLALGEFYSLATKARCKPQIVTGFCAALLIVASFVFEEPLLTVGALIAVAIATLVGAVFRPGELKESLASVSSTIFGVVYVALLASCLVGVRMISDTRFATPVTHLASKALTMFFAIVILTDTGAYYTGRTIGRRKLAPRISPGKTIEGAIGGFVMATVAGYVSKLTFFPEIPLIHCLVLGAVIGIIGQIGDLAESLLKRGSAVKDSGRLLPGHGGMLDRIDSILFSAPVLYFYFRIFFASQ